VLESAQKASELSSESFALAPNAAVDLLFKSGASKQSTQTAALGAVQECFNLWIRFLSYLEARLFALGLPATRASSFQ